MIIPTFNRPRKPKGESAWVWSQYKVSTLDTVWIPKGKSKPINDCLISCIRCNLTTVTTIPGPGPRLRPMVGLRGQGTSVISHLTG
jgi:hypothetical protein